MCNLTDDQTQDRPHPFWGQGPTGEGPNEWGKALMRLRAELRAFANAPKRGHNRARVLVFGGLNPHLCFDPKSPHPIISYGQRYPTSFHLYQSRKVICKRSLHHPGRVSILGQSSLNPRLLRKSGSLKIQGEWTCCDNGILEVSDLIGMNFLMEW
jgi:predicted NAD-dependent protein-ADP-ribosyltransferase YbiA (DUF1768 family)